MTNSQLKNRKAKRKISIFQLLVFLFILSAIIVFYINNIIAVNQLISKNNELKEAINKTTQLNYTYQIEIERLSSLDRIKVLAFEKFGLKLSDTLTKANESLIINKSELK